MMKPSLNLAPLRVENVSKKVGDMVLNAHFSIAVSERMALLGKSGSGKTTLLRLIAGLDPLEGKGRVYLGDQDITDLPPQKREIGFVFQDQALFTALNVMENVTFGLRIRGVSRLERE